MIITMGEFEIDPQQVPQLVPHLNSLMAQTRPEDGCIIFSLVPDPLKPGVVLVSELWEDKDKLSRHLNMPHVRAFHEEISKIGFRRFDVSALDVVNRRDAMELVDTLSDK